MPTPRTSVATTGPGNFYCAIRTTMPTGSGSPPPSKRWRRTTDDRLRAIFCAGSRTRAPTAVNARPYYRITTPALLFDLSLPLKAQLDHSPLSNLLAEAAVLCGGATARYSCWKVKYTNVGVSHVAQRPLCDNLPASSGSHVPMGAPLLMRTDKARLSADGCHGEQLPGAYYSGIFRCTRRC